MIGFSESIGKSNELLMWLILLKVHKLACKKSWIFWAVASYFFLSINIYYGPYYVVENSLYYTSVYH